MPYNDPVARSFAVPMTNDRLTGQELLDFVQNNPNMGKIELAKNAGYVNFTSSGKERAQLNRLYEAVMEAQGINLRGKRGKKQPLRRKYETTVHRNNNIRISSIYVEEMNATQGDVFDIEVCVDRLILIKRPN